MNDYVLKKGGDTPSDDIIWAFDLGKGSIGEAVRQGTKFLHKASLLIPAEFAETKTAAGRLWMWRTRITQYQNWQYLWRVAGAHILVAS